MKLYQILLIITKMENIVTRYIKILKNKINKEFHKIVVGGNNGKKNINSRNSKISE